MIVPIIYPSAGEFWLNFNNGSFPDYSIQNRRLTNLPKGYQFKVTAHDAIAVAKYLSVSSPLYLTAPAMKYKRYGKNCIVLSREIPFPENSFVCIKHKQYDIYIASPELCFLQAARSLDFKDLVKFGYDLCAQYSIDPTSETGQRGRKLITSVNILKEYAKKNRSFYNSILARKALRYVHENSNSPMETKLAIFASLPEDQGGCAIPGLEMNKSIKLSNYGKLLLNCSEIRADLAYKKNIWQLSITVIHFTLHQSN